MELRSSEGATLIGAASDAAARIVILRPGKTAGTSAELPLPAGKAVTLAPDGPRLALAKPAHPLRLGDWVPLTLTLRNADGTRQDIAITAEVRRHSARYDHLHGHAH